jgi:hypothetical protein
MRRFNLLGTSIWCIFAVIFTACSTAREPATPVETFQTYIKAFKKKDITTMKLLLSSDTIKMHEQEARSQGVTLDDIVKRETLVADDQRTVEYRNQKIEGDKATLEYKNQYGSWETIPFVRENGEWKIDKKGYLEQMMKDVEQNNQQLDDMINNGRQPY